MVGLGDCIRTGCRDMELEKMLLGLGFERLGFLRSVFVRFDGLVLGILGFFGLVGCGGSAVDLLRDSDTGYESFDRSDRLTSDATPTLRVKGNKGKEVEAFVGSASVGSGILSQNSGEADVTISLNNDKDFTSVADRMEHYQDHKVEFRYKEGGGILGSITIRLDTVRPENPGLKVVDKDLASESLKGSAGNGVVVEFEVSNVEKGSTLVLFRGADKIAELLDVSGGTEIVRGKVTSSAQSVTARVYDKAGNFSDSGVVTVGASVASSLAYSDGESAEVLPGQEEVESVSLSLEGGYDEKIFLFSRGGEDWEIRGSLDDSGLVFMERGGVRLESLSFGDEHDFVLRGRGYGDWSIGIEGEDNVQLLGVGLDWLAVDGS